MNHFRLTLIQLTLLMLTVSGKCDPWADSVISVNYGTGAGFGQDYFPGNILGPPDSSATPTQPAADATEVLSLGSGGEIVLAFLDGGISDGPGVDFTIFENPFFFGGDTLHVFRETGFVAVSLDGIQWLEFPWDTLALSGLAGVTPVNGAADPTDPASSGGDSFDLADLGLTRATYLRITDTAGTVPDGGDSFDLDAVAVIHGEQGSIAHEPLVASALVCPNPFLQELTLKVFLAQSGILKISVIDLQGRSRGVIAEGSYPEGKTSFYWRSDLPGGIYFFQLETGAGINAVKGLQL
jgi:hypothetical protein